MASRIEVDLIVQAISEGFDKVASNLGDVGDAARRAEDGVEQSGRGASQSGLKWTELQSKLSLASQAFGMVRDAAQQAYNFIKEGAELELAEERFGKLAGTIGTTASALRDDLGEATRGMMTNAESMALAGDLMSLGLAKTHDQTVRLTRVASSLNMDMNQLVLTLTNQTTMRFDSLGVAVDGFDDRLDNLKATGMSTNEAFTEAFLQQAEAQILKVGDAADTTAGKLEVLENRAEDSWNRLKQQALEGAEPVIDSLLRMADGHDVLAEAQERGLITEREMRRLMRDFGTPALKEATDATIEHLQAQMADTDAALAAADAYERRREALQGTKQEFDEVSQAILDYESRREGIWTQETLEIKFGADTSEARAELEDLITDYSGQVIPFEVLPTLRGRGNEKAQGEEVMRPVKDALKNLPGMAEVVAEYKIGANFEQAIIDMEAGLISVQDIIDGPSRPEVVPETDISNLEEITSYLDGEVQGSIDAIFGTEHMLVTHDNLPELDGKLGNTLALVQQVTGTKYLNIVMTTTGSPYGGPYDLPNGP